MNSRAASAPPRAMLADTSTRATMHAPAAGRRWET